MKNCVIIAEYNPFHNGHKWQIEKARQLGAKHITVIMSGNYVQRGSPAILPKDIRTKCALSQGVDLIIELPTPYAVSTAETFAKSGIHLANSLNFIDSIVFGAETPDTNILFEIASFLLTEQFNEELKENLNKNISYAQARAITCEKFISGSKEILSLPNNILAIEYCKAIISTNSKIKPYPLVRIGTSHHSKKENGIFASASYIRNNHLEECIHLMPNLCYNLLIKSKKNGRMLNYTKYELASISRLKTVTPTNFTNIADVDNGLKFAICKAISKSTNLEEIFFNAKSKRYALSRIRRIILSQVIGITKPIPKLPPYIRILGANKNAFALLGENRKNITLPYSHKLSYLKSVNDDCECIASMENNFTDFYNIITDKPLISGEEYRYQLIKGENQ